MKKPKTKQYQYDLENIKVGDIIYDVCNSGFGSGGYGYGIGERVIKITKNYIYCTKADKYYNKFPYKHVIRPIYTIKAYTQDERNQ